MSPPIDEEIAEIKRCMECIQRDVQKAREVESELKTYVKGAMDSFNHDLVQTFRAQEKRLDRVERALWGEHGTNGVMGTILLITERQQSIIALAKWTISGIAGIILAMISFVAIEYVVPDFRNKAPVGDYRHAVPTTPDHNHEEGSNGKP